jgi:Mg2+ and Co2+ transporter CorA
MEVRWVDAEGVHASNPADVRAGASRDGGFHWVDIPVWDEQADELLAALGCHPLLRQSCARRNFVPTVHGYDDHVFITVQSPLAGAASHVHVLELDQVIGTRFLVTVHGPFSPGVDPEEGTAETGSALHRMETGRFRPATPTELSYAITSAVARRQSAFVRDVATRLPGLETEVMASELRNPEGLLETMFLARHELVTARTMAAQSREVWTRLAEIGRLADDPEASRSHDLADQFDRVRSLADGEAQFLFGVIELYQTKVHTKMTVAMERLAVIAAVTLPITAIASIAGMNVVVGHHSNYVALVVLLVMMLAISLWLLRWARRQGWW